MWKNRCFVLSCQKSNLQHAWSPRGNRARSVSMSATVRRPDRRSSSRPRSPSGDRRRGPPATGSRPSSTRSFFFEKRTSENEPKQKKTHEILNKRILRFFLFPIVSLLNTFALNTFALNNFANQYFRKPILSLPNTFAPKYLRSKKSRGNEQYFSDVLDCF